MIDAKKIRAPVAPIAILASAIAALAIAGVFWPLKNKTAYTIESFPYTAPDPAAPSLPDISTMTPQAVRNKIPALSPGSLQRVRMYESLFYSYMSMNDMIPSFGERQKRVDPEVIELESGIFDLSSIAAGINNPDLIHKEKNSWILRAPILILPGASLIIEDQENQLKLVEETGTFIANFGKLYITDTSIKGWREDLNTPASFRHKKQF